MTTGPAPQLGAWVKLPAPESIELLALAGFDFVVIDAEHGAIDVRTMSTMIGVAIGCSVAPFVRVPGIAPRDVQVPLDAGARGLFVPQVDDPSRARAAVAATRFPPLGRRGASTSGRAGGWGLDDLDEYLKSGNDEVRLVVAAESAEALTAIADIAAVPGVDAVFIGPMDLAVSSRLPLGDPTLTALVRAAERRCVDHGITVGTTASGDAAQLLERGYSFLLLGADTMMLRAHGRSLVDSARATGARR
ncbi:MAG TPA: aldolase/citrate lyase family protein [Pseudonocardia sp.]